MVIDTFLGILLGFFAFVLDLFPAFTAPDFGSDWLNDMHSLGGYTQLVDKWVNVELAADLIGALVVMLLLWGAVKAILWIYERVPFKAA